jgi:NADH-quinone oxidoreductase E subunit
MPLAFSPKAEEQFQELLRHYPNKMAPLIMALHLAQDDFGQVGPEVQAYVAQRLGLPPAFVLGVVSFYSMFHQEPVGKHHVEVCTNLSCQIRGGDELLAHCQKRLGIKPHETTADGRITLGEVECLAACGVAPALQVNGEFHENMTVEKLDKLLDGLK